MTAAIRDSELFARICTSPCWGDRNTMKKLDLGLIVVWILTIYISFVFIQSLFFKFSNSPETQHIFGTLDTWADTFGYGGAFSPSGIFSQYVVGTAELMASALLLSGLFLRRPELQRI